MRKSAILFFLLVVVLSSCAEEGFESSEVIKDFPIPAAAKPIDSMADQQHIIAFQKYRYSNNGEPQGISQEYAKAIEEAGWSELKEEQEGASRVFTDGERKVSMVARADSISLFELKE